MDVHTKEQRSYNMSRVKSENTKPELLLFSELKKAGYKFKKHYQIEGRPDIAFPEIKLAIFLDGEFWHGKGFNQWKNKLSKFWVEKIESNLKRDRKVREQLKSSGWRVIRVWGKDVVKNPNKVVSMIKKELLKITT